MVDCFKQRKLLRKSGRIGGSYYKYFQCSGRQMHTVSCKAPYSLVKYIAMRAEEEKNSSQNITMPLLSCCLHFLVHLYWSDTHTCLTPKVRGIKGCAMQINCCLAPTLLQSSTLSCSLIVWGVSWWHLPLWGELFLLLPQLFRRVEPENIVMEPLYCWDKKYGNWGGDFPQLSLNNKMCSKFGRRWLQKETKRTQLQRWLKGSYWITFFWGY